MWRAHLNQHVSGVFPGDIPQHWLQDNGFFICNHCHQLVSESHTASHNFKCLNKTSSPTSYPIPSTEGTDNFSTQLPTLDEILQLNLHTVRHNPQKIQLPFAFALSSSLQSAIHQNTVEAWTKLFFCFQSAVCLLCSVLVVVTKVMILVPYANFGMMVNMVPFGIWHSSVTLLYAPPSHLLCSNRNEMCQLR